MVALCNILFVFFFLSVSVISQELSECDVILGLDVSMNDRACLEEPASVDDEVIRYVCDDVETMLEAVASDTIDGGLNCTEIQIPAGEHIIRQNFTFTNKNLRIVRDDLADLGSARITFQIDQSIIDNLMDYEPLYVLQFESSEFVEILGLFFPYSPGIILVTNVSFVTFENNEFSYFLESALDIYNCLYVTVSNCTFQHSGHNANFLKKRNYSIHGGAVSVAVDVLEESNILPLPYSNILNCLFYNNSAIPSQSLTRSTNDIFSNQVFTGRGGGLGIALNGPFNSIQISISNCHFEENHVQLWGGGVYILFGMQSNHTATTQDSVYIRNRSGYGAGGFFLGTFSGGNQERYSTANIIGCDFINNHAFHGGGSVWPVPRAEDAIRGMIFNVGLYENCRFINNTAYNIAGLSLVTADAYRSQLSHAHTEIANCTFLGNDGGTTPVFSALYVPIILTGYNKFDNNKGGAVQIVGSTAAIKGTLEITNTDLIDTRIGALSLLSLAQLTLYKGARLIFENNTGSVGAAFVTEATRISEVFAGVHFNPLCSLLYEDIHTSPNDWTDVGMTFSGNKAIVGAAIFTSQLRVCSWTQFKNPYFNESNAFKWNFVEFGENENTFHDGDYKSAEYNVQTPGQTLEIFNGNISVYPGENFTMFVKVEDELGNSVFSAIRTRDPQIAATDFHSSFVFDPPVHTLNSKSQNISAIALVHFDFLSDNLTQINPVDVQSIENAIFFEQDTPLSALEIQFKECPPGYVLKSQQQNFDFQICKCNTENSEIVTCSNGTVLFEHNLWATNDESAKDRLFTLACPLGYCECGDDASNCYNTYDYNNPDDQCTAKRKGILCGECRSSGEGVSALLNKCVTCHDGYSVLIPALIIIDVIAVVVLVRFFLCHQFPSWLFPCIFYIQFLPLVTLPFTNGFQLYRQYLFYVSSAMSFYFPYDFCLYHNMNMLVSYLLRFVPVFTVSITLIIMIIYCWRFVKLVWNRDWYLVWILVLLMYQFTLYNSMNILNCPSVPTVKGQRGHWFISGNIQCFTGGHIPLALFAIIMIILLVSLIPISFVLSLKVYERPIWVKRIQRPLSFWFKEEYKWWFSVELLRRFLLVLMIVPFSGKAYPVSVVYYISFALFSYAQPYTSFYANILEVVFSVIAIMLYNLEGHLKFNALSAVDYSPTQRPTIWIGGVLYYIPLLIVILSVTIHISLEMKNKIQKFSRNRKTRKSIKKEERQRNFSMAIEINKVVSTTHLEISAKEERHTIMSTVIEGDDKDKNEIKYSMEKMDIIITK